MALLENILIALLANLTINFDVSLSTLLTILMDDFLVTDCPRLDLGLLDYND